MTMTKALLVGSGIYAVLHAFMSNDTWTQAARAARPRKPNAIAATMNLLRHTGVLLASSGLEV